MQADRGTLLLDEIGELPLEAQSRLLRFVQDRHVTPVGGPARPHGGRARAGRHQPRAGGRGGRRGRFRADLYHRLNVVRLDIPALRERPDDVRHLADHFAKTYALIYGRPAGSFSPEAAAAVLHHHWPGNVRELQNRVMRAVILGRSGSITPADLGLTEDEDPVRDEPRQAQAAPVPRPEEPPRAEGEAWECLRAALRQQIDQALGGQRPLAPLGRWLADDLVREADTAAGRVASRAAALLGTPLTTFRRRLEGSHAHGGLDWPPRPPSWPAVRTCLVRLLHANEASARNLLKEVPRPPGGGSGGQGPRRAAGRRAGGGHPADVHPAAVGLSPSTAIGPVPVPLLGAGTMRGRGWPATGAVSPRTSSGSEETVRSAPASSRPSASRRPARVSSGGGACGVLR